MAQDKTARHLIPRNDFVLLEELKPLPYHAYRGLSKIIVPPAYEHGPEDRPVMGRVLAKGEACTNPRIPVAVMAITGKWTGARFRFNEQTLILVKETDILAILE